MVKSWYRKNFSRITLKRDTVSIYFDFICDKDPLKKLRTPFNFFLVNLSVADLIVGAVTMPISVYGHYSEYTGYMDTTISESIHLSSLMSGSASLFSIIALSLDRCLAITRAIEYRKHLSWRRCAQAATLVWGVSLTTPFLVLVIGYMEYLMFFMSSAIMTGVVVMVTVNTLIRRTLRKQNREMGLKLGIDRNSTTTSSNNTFQQQQRAATERKVTKLFFLITAVFTAIYLPAAVLIFVLHFCQSCSCTPRHVMRDVQFLLTAANSLANPFVCTLRSKVYKNSVKKMFSEWCSCFDRHESTKRSSKRRFVHDDEHAVDSTTVNSNVSIN